MAGVVADVDVQSESEGPRCSFADRLSSSRMLGTPSPESSGCAGRTRVEIQQAGHERCAPVRVLC